MNPDCSARTVQQQTKDGHNLVRLAAAAHRDALPGLPELCAEAERFYVIVLANISQMTDEEADLIQPIFMEFDALFRAVCNAEETTIRV